MLASLAMGAGVWLSGCAGEGSGPGPATTTTTNPGFASIEEVQNQIFTPTCAFSGCHNTASRQGNLDLSSAAISHGQLVGVVSECAGLTRVVPGDPDSSYLLHKVGDGPEPCGTLMPQLLPPLTAEQIALIRSWIEGGAQPPPAAAAAGSADSPMSARSDRSSTVSEGPTSSSSTTSSTQE